LTSTNKAIRKDAIKQITDKDFLNKIINSKNEKYKYTERGALQNSSYVHDYERHLGEYARERLIELNNKV
jgi:hypothetical protein